MGFKRTSDGRIFFDTTSNQDELKVVKKAIKQSNSNKAAPTAQEPTKTKQEDLQRQILTMLRSLNLKLQASEKDKSAIQAELEQTKTLLAEMQGKADQSEQKTQELEKKLTTLSKTNSSQIKNSQSIFEETLQEFEETRKLIIDIEDRSQRTENQVKQQSALIRRSEEEIKTQFRKLEENQIKESKELVLRINSQERNQKQLDSRLEETSQSAIKIERKLEKTVQDRSRLIRKLERIEETVLQTNDALNARALVLLTDQATAEGSTRPYIPATSNENQTQSQDEDIAQAAPWYRKSYNLQTKSMASMLVICTLAGWAISDIQRPDGFFQSFSAPEFSENENQFSSFQVTTPSARIAQTSQTPPDSSNTYDDLEIENTALSNQEVAFFSQNNNSVDSQTTPLSKEQDSLIDLDTLDIQNEEQLLELMHKDPEKLAAKLNEIEPSALNTSLELKKTDNITVSEKEIPVQKVTTIQPKTPELSANLPDLEGKSSDRISPDTELPSDLKSIEEKAFEGNGEAQHDLAAIYITGYEGLEPNMKRAQAWFVEAAHNGVANARYNLGVLNHQGIGIEQNIEDAFMWYKSAAALNHPEAQYNLGMAYIEGIGVEYNPQSAAEFFESAARQGVTEAAYNLGLIYENGLMGTAKPDHALMWYKIASDQGSPEAKGALEQLANTLGIKLSDINKLVEGMKVLDKKKLKNNPEFSQSSQPKQENTPAKPDPYLTLVSGIQSELIEMGLYPGPANGQENMMTKDAIRSYQSLYSLPETGQSSPELLKHMQTLDNSESNDLGSRE